MCALWSKNQTETERLDETVDRLPDRVADWTPAQHAAFVAQSDRVMREQNGVPTDAG